MAKKAKKNKMVANVLVGAAAVVAGGVGYGLIFHKDPMYLITLLHGNGASGNNAAALNPVTPATTPSQALQSGFPIQKGSKGAEVRTLQNALISKYGASILPRFGADGDFGSETVAALSGKGLPTSFATKADLDATVGSLRSNVSTVSLPQSTSTGLFSFPALYTDGKKYDSVLALQKALNQRGFTDYEGKKLVEDGIIGKRTGAAMAKANFDGSSNIFPLMTVAILPISEGNYNAFMGKMFPFAGLGAMPKATVYAANGKFLNGDKVVPILNIDGSPQNLAPEGVMLGRAVGESRGFYTFITSEGDSGLVEKNSAMLLTY
jgi:peptidoglycan hydrolase-like protein with peptidoglycan-binding domain